MEISLCSYRLQSCAELNARSTRREIEGVLIRVGGGFGCLQPWPELGDSALDVLLEDLGGRREQPLVVGALRMAEEDARFRAQGRSLLEGAVESHVTMVNPTSPALEQAVGLGFRVVKVKGGRDWEGTARALQEWNKRFPSLRWRIDFNEVLSAEETVRFAEELGDQARAQIDFLEDPCPYEPDRWSKLQQECGLSLAMDAGVTPESVADVLVLKPAREAIEPFFAAQQRLVVTSSMDHPLGQCWAAAMAQRLAETTGRAELAGLQTHTLFAPTAFSRELAEGPWFERPPGAGLGFDELLDELPWSPL